MSLLNVIFNTMEIVERAGKYKKFSSDEPEALVYY